MIHYAAAASSSQGGDEEGGDGNDQNHPKKGPTHGGSFLIFLTLPFIQFWLKVWVFVAAFQYNLVAEEEEIIKQEVNEPQKETKRPIESGIDAELTLSEKHPPLVGEKDSPLDERGGGRDGGGCIIGPDPYQRSFKSDTGTSSNRSGDYPSLKIEENRRPPIPVKTPPNDLRDAPDKEESKDDDSPVV